MTEPALLAPGKLAASPAGAVTRKRGKRVRSSLNVLRSNLGLLPFTLFCVIPFLWMIKTAFESHDTIFQEVPHWIPLAPTLENFQAVLTDPTAGTLLALKNSVIIAIGSAVLGLTLTTLAGYAMSRFRFRGKVLLIMYLLASQMIPGSLTLIVIYVIIAKLGMLNTYQGLILAHGSLAVPFSSLMLKGYFDSIPFELEEQAMIDGCSRLQSLIRIVMPLARPALAAVAMFLFLSGWSDFILALTLITDQATRPISTQIVYWVGLNSTDWGPVMAYSVVTVTPVMVAFVLLQRYIVRGLTAGFSK